MCCLAEHPPLSYPAYGISREKILIAKIYQHLLSNPSDFRPRKKFLKSRQHWQKRHSKAGLGDLELKNNIRILTRSSISLSHYKDGEVVPIEVGDQISKSLPLPDCGLTSLVNSQDDNRHNDRPLWDQESNNEDKELYGQFQNYLGINSSLEFSMFTEPNSDTELQTPPHFEVFIPQEPLCPITVPAPYGSGRKGKNKTKEEYSNSTSTFGYKGSYRQYPTHANVRQSERGRDDDDDDDSNNPKDGSGSGRRDDEGNGGGRDDEIKKSQAQQALAKNPDVSSVTLNYGVTMASAPVIPSNHKWECCAGGRLDLSDLFKLVQRDDLPHDDCLHYKLWARENRILE